MLFNLHQHIKSIHPGITAIYNINIPEEENQLTSDFFSAGIHPWTAEKNNLLRNLEKISVLAKQDHCLAIGECGTDKLKGPPFDIQHEIFEAQARLAMDFKKPLIIHVVKSYDETLQLRKKLKPQQAWIIHGFRKDIQLAHQLIEKGFMLSLGKAFLESKNLWKLIDNQYIKSIFFESDEEPGHIIPALYSKASQLKNIRQNELERIIQDNFERTFNRKIDGIKFVETED